MTKMKEERPYSDPEKAAHKILEIANGLDPYMDGRLLTEKLNWAMLTEFKASPAEWKAGIDYAVAQGWLWAHESGTITSSPKSGTTYSAGRPAEAACVCSLRSAQKKRPQRGGTR
jgi:hypothetical protein